jgi:ribosomal protein L37AE/L43A
MMTSDEQSDLERLTRHDFYCRYGKHFAKKEEKINTARQGDYICQTCEEVRTRDWVKSQVFTRRHNDRREDYYTDED